MERKGFGPRLLAAVIDGAILMGFFCVVGMMTGMGSRTVSANGTVVVTTGARVGTIIGALFVLAYTSTEIFLAGSPGKLILKMKIGSETGAVPAPQDQLIRRWLIKSSGSLLNLLYAFTFIGLFWWLASLAGLVILVGCFFALGANRQALHDVLAHTAVYGTAPATQQGFQPIMGGGYGTGVGPGPVNPGGPVGPPPPPPAM
jgi:uncharacterized RDD family membrane protein YckC